MRHAAVRGRGRARARRPALRHHVPARPRRARGHHAVRVPRRALRHRVLFVAPAAWIAARGMAGSPRCSGAPGSIAGLLLFGGYATQTVGLQYTSRFHVGVHHRPLRRPHAGGRGRRVPTGSRASGVGRDRARDDRPVPPHRRRRSPRARRAPHAGVRGAVRRPHRVHRRVRAPRAAGRRSPACSSEWWRCSRCPRPARRASAPSPRSRCSRWCSRASRARRSRSRSSSGASAASRRRVRRSILLAEPVFAGVADFVNGERLGALRGRGRRGHPGGHRRVGARLRVAATR